MGVMSLVLINICAVVSLRNMPVLATSGWSLIFWYLLFTVAFLIPTALVSADLSFRCPKAGGMYAWIKEANSGKMGFVGIFAMWTNNLIWFPAVISYMVIIFTYSIASPELAENTLFMGCTMLLAVAGFTAFNMFLNRYASRFIAVGTMLGTIIPFVLLIVLSAVWILSGNVSLMEPFSFKALLPHGSDSLTFAGNIIFVFTGMEIAGFYLVSAKDPYVTAPRAAFIASAIILAVSIIGTIAVASVVQPEFLFGISGMNGGVLEAFHIMFDSFGLSWLMLPLGLLLLLGVVVQVSTYMDGPGRGLQRAAMDGYMPEFFRKTSKDGAPKNIFLVHGLVSSLFVGVYVLTMGSQFNAYWILTSMATLMVIVKYYLLFDSYLKVRRKNPDVKTGFKFGNGKLGIVMAYLGIIVLLFSFVFVLTPPVDYGMITNLIYAGIILLVFVVVGIIIPLLLYAKKKDSWNPTEEEMRAYLRNNNELDD